MKLFSLLLLCFCLLSCGNRSTRELQETHPDSLQNNTDLYTGQEIVLAGKVLHVCPVRGRKMKLQCSNGMIVKVSPSNPADFFERTWNGKKVRILGKVTENRISRNRVDSLETAGRLLCHIDHGECIDTAWISNMRRHGKAEESLKKAVENLRKTMENTGKEYVQVLTLTAVKVEEIEIITEESGEDLKTACATKEGKCGLCALCGLCFQNRRL